MQNKEKISAAEKLFRLGYKLQMEGDLTESIKAYKNSLYYNPTAKTYTHLGWAYSQMGKYHSAVKQCILAIETDPEYGSAYNDLGTYLYQLKKYDEAIMWLEKALTAVDYKPKHFPLFNLGRVYEKKGDWFTALEYYNEVLERKPDYEPAKTAAIKLMASMN